MSETERQPQARPRPQSPALAGVSMHDLLASCAAAAAISTPPPAPEPEACRPVRQHREAA
ncbi:hypothetical protein [Streptomyces lancefieldiae]|uniref:Uncharacterized protein n=1 Tax=Streptomyces lancefieldiae TaxID=3075520 RepID=A0ABU3AJ32_9ACTN|nr:hypothetical protein [Streptomyces sp. DSM 40712]MDT0610195.1 hypothetical protein [Streptomyces sp. DSM 40712]